MNCPICGEEMIWDEQKNMYYCANDDMFFDEQDLEQADEGGYGNG